MVNAAMVAKAGLVARSKGLSEQIGQHGITVNCVQPDLIDTAQIRRLIQARSVRNSPSAKSPCVTSVSHRMLLTRSPSCVASRSLHYGHRDAGRWRNAPSLILR